MSAFGMILAFNHMSALINAIDCAICFILKIKYFPRIIYKIMRIPIYPRSIDRFP